MAGQGYVQVNGQWVKPTAGKATGLDYVPYNGFAVSLHRGEMVLNSTDADAYRSGVGLQYGSSPQDIAAAVASALRGMSVNMDGVKVGTLVADTVSEAIAMTSRQRRFG